MKCALCRINNADKKNTHFLTDAIIRTCLDQNGENERDRGFYYNISSDVVFTDFNFQRGANPEIIMKELGRNPSEQEITRAVDNPAPFSVNYVFCAQCEDVFTDIEGEFCEKHLSMFRSDDLTGREELIFEETKLLRKFFLLQVWRTAVCTEQFDIADESKEKIRNAILNSALEEINDFPIIVTYLQTVGSGIANTANIIAIAPERNPNVIIMNDFVIQFFDSRGDLNYLTLYGINEGPNFEKFLNYDRENFIIKVIPDKRRREILKLAVTDFRAKPIINKLRNTFIAMWMSRSGITPSQEVVDSFITGLFDWGHLPQAERMNQERINRYFKDFFDRLN